MPSLSDWKPYDYEVPNTVLDVQIHDEHVLVDSALDITRKSDSNQESLFLNGSELDGEGFGLELLEIKVDGNELDNNEYSVDDDGLTIHSVPDACSVQIRQKITIPDRAVDGLYRSGETLITQCEDESFRKIAFYPDRPDVLSKWRVRVEADKEKYPVLLSNGDESAREDVEDSRHAVTFEDPHAKPCYLFALAAGKLASLRSTFKTRDNREVELTIYSDEKSIRYCTWAMTCLKDAMAWDEFAYDRVYDLDRFAIVAVEKFVFGAMENKSLNVFNNLVLLASPDIATDQTYDRIQTVVGHEYFHNYSGNRVTVRDWFQLSLKEGFTVLRDQTFSRYMQGFDHNRIRDAEMLRREQFPEAQSGLSHPVRPADMVVPENYYTRTIYEGGAELVYMLSNMLGREQWLAATNHYFEKHDGQAVTIDDFVDAVAESSGRDLSQFKRWYSTAGTPVLDIEESRENGDICLSIKQSILSSLKTAEQPILEIPLGIGLVDDETGELLGAFGTADRGEAIEIETNVDYTNPQRDGTLVFHVNEKQSDIRLKDVPEDSYVSLHRDFSAPIEIRYSSSAGDAIELERLKYLAQHDINRCAKFDAVQQLFVGATLDFDTFGEVLTEVADEQLRVLRTLGMDLTDRYSHALELTLPNVGRVLDLHKGTPVESITAGLDNVAKHLGSVLNDQWIALTEEYRIAGAYEPSVEQSCYRRLLALAYRYLLAATEEQDLPAFAKDMAEKFSEADNLTDRLTYFNLLLRTDGQVALQKTVSDEFYESCKDESLVVEKWIGAVIEAPALGAQDRIAELEDMGLLENPTPNRWRAVFSAFTDNWENFHAADGSGYEYYTDRLIKDAANHASVVRRGIQPLAYLHRHDENRQGMMKACLERLLKDLPQNNKPALDMAERALQPFANSQ